MIIVEGRSIVDRLLMKQLNTEERLFVSTNNVKSKTFESPIAKLQTSKENNHAIGDISVIQSLKLKDSAKEKVAECNTKTIPLAQLAFKETKTDDKRAVLKFLTYVFFFVSVPSVCDRFFFKVGIGFRDYW